MSDSRPTKRILPQTTRRNVPALIADVLRNRGWTTGSEQTEKATVIVATRKGESVTITVT